MSKKTLSKLLIIPEVKSWRAVMSAFQSVYRPLEKALLEENCSIPRFQIMFYLYFEGPQSQVAIAKKLFVTRGNISMFFKRLVTDGIIEVFKPTKSDKRPLFCLTSKGMRFFENLFPRHIARVKKRMPKLKPNVIALLNLIGKEL